MTRWTIIAALALAASPAMAQDMGADAPPMQDDTGQPAPAQAAPRARVLNFSARAPSASSG